MQRLANKASLAQVTSDAAPASSATRDNARDNKTPPNSTPFEAARNRAQEVWNPLRDVASSSEADQAHNYLTQARSPIETNVPVA